MTETEIKVANTSAPILLIEKVKQDETNNTNQGGMAYTNPPEITLVYGFIRHSRLGEKSTRLTQKQT